MKHVFVESNWVYDYCSPRHLRKPDAESLAGRAANGELVLHVPGICLREGASSVRRKSQPKDADIKEFRRWAAQAGEITPEDATAAVRFLDRYRLRITTDLNDINARLDALVASPGVDTFGLNEAMLQRVLRLRGTVPEDADLKPFDEAILGAVVVRAEELRGAGELLPSLGSIGSVIPGATRRHGCSGQHVLAARPPQRDDMTGLNVNGSHLPASRAIPAPSGQASLFHGGDRGHLLHERSAEQDNDW
jgi:hypothetical protein